jgi:hypothetical protein
MTLRLGTLSDASRYEAWICIVERIYREQVNQAWSHYMFRLLRAIFLANEKLSHEGAFVLRWMVDNYVDAALMFLRRELDQQAGTENLRNLLLDMIDHPTVATRARYLSKWGQEGPFDRGHANRTFDRFAPRRVRGNADSDHIDPDLIRADLNRMVTSTEQARKYAERTRAHRTPERSIDTDEMTFDAMHKAIADIRGTVKKYYALLTLKAVAQWEPVPQYDTLEAFMKPWVVDRTAVERATEESTDE